MSSINFTNILDTVEFRKVLDDTEVQLPSAQRLIDPPTTPSKDDYKRVLIDHHGKIKLFLYNN